MEKNQIDDLIKVIKFHVNKIEYHQRLTLDSTREIDKMLDAVIESCLSGDDFSYLSEELKKITFPKIKE
jgi:hypothetical protein